MSLLLESIRIENKQWHNLKLHEARMMHARQQLFGISEKIDLAATIPIPISLSNHRYKCRILYGLSIEEVQFERYFHRKVSALHLVKDDTIRYALKFADRACITQHTEGLPEDAEIIIVKKGLLRDASYSNIALYNGLVWHTPAYPLLKGTKRQELLSKGLLVPKVIKVADFSKYQKVSFINALNDLEERTYTLKA